MILLLEVLLQLVEMLQKLFLTGIIVLIFSGKTLQVVIVVRADLLFLMNLLIPDNPMNHHAEPYAFPRVFQWCFRISTLKGASATRSAPWSPKSSQMEPRKLQSQ